MIEVEATQEIFQVIKVPAKEAEVEADMQAAKGTETLIFQVMTSKNKLMSIKIRGQLDTSLTITSF